MYWTAPSRLRLPRLGRWLSLPLIDRYLAGQLVPPFLFSVGLVASFGVAIGYLSDLGNKIVEKNLPLEQALEILLLKVPEFLAYALPIAVLLSALLTFGRLGGDSELVALRACGAGLFRLAVPVVCLSLVATGLTYGVGEWIVPAANYRATAILVDSIQEEHPFWQNRDIFYPEFEEVKTPQGKTERRLKRLIYAERFDGKTMEELTVLQWSGSRLNKIIISDQAAWNPQRRGWDFFEGAVYPLKKDASYQESEPFQARLVELPKSAFDFALQGRDPYEMNIQEARAYMDILRLIGDRKKLNFFQVRTEQKAAFPFVCVVFGLVGMAVGARPQRLSRATGFGLSVFIVFAYYLVGFAAGSLGMAELLSPALAAWAPNLIGLAVGVGLLYRFNQG